MIDQNILSQIVTFLELEKITINQKTSLYFFPTKRDDDFLKKFEYVKKDLKKLDPHIDIQLVEEGELEYVRKYIELPYESGSNGT
jgi:hypothetical protein